MGKWREGGKIKKGRREKKREVEAEEKEGLQHKLIDMQSGCSSIRVHTLAKARTTDTILCGPNSNRYKGLVFFRNNG